MSRQADVPEKYRPYYFANAGGPARQVVSREPAGKKWQLVTLDCSHRLLVPLQQRAAKVGCGFCGGVSQPPAPDAAGTAPG